nr:YeeE/YedE family protein [Microvirga antarctica]
MLSAFASGLLFGLGLIVAQMIDPQKVLGFLDVFGRWDPSLALVMASAVAVSALGFAAAKRLRIPLFARKLDIPNRRDLDARLVIGSSLFGIGWGLVGLCPGPAIVNIAAGTWQILVFVAAMMVGMGLVRFVPQRKPSVPPSRAVPSVDG